MNIGDVVRVKTIRTYEHSGQLGLITGRTGDHYYHVLLESGEFLYADVALEVLCCKQET